MLQLITID